MTPFERALAAGCTVLIARDGWLIRVYPDHSEERLREIPQGPPIPVRKGMKFRLRRGSETQDAVADDMPIKHKGRATYRFQDNPEEKRFADAWQQANDQGHILEYAYGDGMRKGDPSPDAVESAATVMQWLGSPVGQAFLRDLGYVKKEGA